MIVAEKSRNWQVAELNGQNDCPFCGSEMKAYTDGWECVDGGCRYYQSEDIRNVVKSLLSEDYEMSVIVEIVDNIDIACQNGNKFKIDSPELMNWALRRLASLDAHIARTEAASEAEIAAIRSRTDEILKSPRTERQTFYTYFAGQMEAFARADMAVTKKKSAKYLYGEVKITATRDKLKILDSEQLAHMLIGMNRDDLVKTVQTPMLDPLKAAYSELPNMCKELIEFIPAGENVKITPLMPLPGEGN